MRALGIPSLVLTATMLFGCSSDDPAAPSGTPADGPLVYLTFAGNANDQSGNGNHGTVVGGSMATGALVLGNNATDRLSLPSTVMDGLGDFTFSAWLRMDTFRNENHEVISGANAAQDNALIFWYREQTDEWLVGINNGSSAFATNASIEDGEWHQVVLTRSGTTAHLYLDGTALGGGVSVAAGALDIDPTGLIFGQDQDVVNGDFAANESWAGAMDNLRIYDRVVSAAEIQTLAAEAH